MHPLLVNRARLGTYLLAWVPGAVLLAGQLFAQGWRPASAILLAVTACLLGAVLFLSSWYLCRVVPLRGSRAYSFVGLWASASMSMGAIWIGALWLLERLFSALSLLHETVVGFTAPDLLSLWGTGTIFYIVTVASHYLLIAQERHREAEQTELELHELAREAELKALRAQLNPHFLFNSLNSISALTTLDPAGARRMCVLLSEFLRSSLKLGAQSEVSLGEEIRLARNYLAIEQVRFGDRLQVDWEIAQEAESVPIPALLLQPLVENAIKHGIAPRLEGGALVIRAASVNGQVELRLMNARDPEVDKPQGLGLGLQQVRQRLRARWGAAASLEASVRGDLFEVAITFPAEGEIHA